MVKGPNTLVDILDNLLKFQSYEVVLVFDITKAYNSIKTGLAEHHLRRLLYVDGTQKDWKVFGLNCMSLETNAWNP